MNKTEALQKIKDLEKYIESLDRVPTTANEITSVEDACKVLNITVPKNLSSFEQLKLIIKAANKLDNGGEEWIPDFTDSSYNKYMAIFKGIKGGAGFGFRFTDGWGTVLGCPVGLYFKKSDTCSTLAQRFETLYIDYLKS